MSTWMVFAVVFAALMVLAAWRIICRRKARARWRAHYEVLRQHTLMTFRFELPKDPDEFKRTQPLIIHGRQQRVEATLASIVLVYFELCGSYSEARQQGLAGWTEAQMLERLIEIAAEKARFEFALALGESLGFHLKSDIEEYLTGAIALYAPDDR
jgi:hypothetical protein